MSTGKRNGFDRLAPYYDLLSRLIYRGEIQNAQTQFLHKIPCGSDVLILGGGTGWIVSAIRNVQPDCRICFIDSASGMIEQAKKKNPEIQQVTFIQGTVADIPSKKFSVIILPFFLDLFSEETLRQTIRKIEACSQSSSLWIITDFTNRGKWWQIVLLRVMYIFFRIFCNIESHSLPDWQGVFEEQAFRKLESKSFCRGFIESCSYVRSSESS